MSDEVVNTVFVQKYDGHDFPMPFIDYVPPHTEAEIAQLETSIGEEGITEKVVVRKGTYEVIDGHTRLRIGAAKGLKFADLPLEERDVTYDEAEVLAVRLNVVRRQLDQDKITAMAIKFRSERGWSARRIARALGVVHVTVLKRLHEHYDKTGEQPPEKVEGTDGREFPAAKPRKEKPPAPEQPPADAAPAPQPDASPSVPDVAKTEQAKTLAQQSIGKLARALDALGLYAKYRDLLQSLLSDVQ